MSVKGVGSQLVGEMPASNPKDWVCLVKRTIKK